MIREIAASPHMKDVISASSTRGDFFSDRAMAAELSNCIHTVYHPVGTCRPRRGKVSAIGAYGREVKTVEFETKQGPPSIVT